MRVIGGSAKGTRLARPPGGTRPLSDRAREGLFSSLGDLVEGARCLDLYAGTGALGIEALSRGASSSDFVDASAGAVRVIRENLDHTGFEDRGKVVRVDAGRYLGRDVGPYDLALVDPPYAEFEGALRTVLSRLVTRLVPDATFVLTRGVQSPTDVIPVKWRVVRRLSYGDTRIFVCREEH